MLITKDNVARKLAESGIGIIAEDLYGVTTVLNVLDKPALPVWAARLCLDAVRVELRKATTLADVAFLLDPSLDGYSFADKSRDKAAGRGTDLHGATECLSLAFREGVREIEPHQLGALAFLYKLDDEKAWLLGCFWRWLAEWTPRIKATERAVVCLHCQAAATLDLELWFQGNAWTLDTKTGSGVYDTGALQVCFQSHAAQNMHPDWKISRRTKWGAHRYTVEGLFASGARDHVVTPAGKTGLIWLDPNADASQPFSSPGVQVFETTNDKATLEAWFAVNAAYKWRKHGLCWVGDGPMKKRKGKA